jgi:hypothetical protein
MSTYIYNPDFTAILTNISTSDPQYSGNIFTVPPTVTNNSNIYNVTSVGDGTNSVAADITNNFSIAFPVPSPVGSSIASNAFLNSTFLIGLSIDPTISITAFALDGCTNLPYVLVNGTKVIFTNVNNGDIVSTLTNSGTTLTIFSTATINSTIYPVEIGSGSQTTNTENIVEIHIPSGPTKIVEFCFKNSPALTTVIFDDVPTIDFIGNSVFAYCPLLVNLIIPHSLRKIGPNALLGCTSLSAPLIFTTPTLSTVLDDMFNNGAVGSEETFTGCTNLPYIIIQNIDNTEYCVGVTNTNNTDTCEILSNVLTIKESLTYNSITYPIMYLGCNTTLSGTNTVTTLNIGTNIVQIGKGAFQGFQIQTVNFSNNSSLNRIGIGAFSYVQLSSIVLPSSITAIDLYVFASTTLVSCDLSNTSITVLSPWVFNDCQFIQTVSFPSTLTDMQPAFLNCPALKNIWFNSSFPPTIPEYPEMFGNTSYTPLIVGHVTANLSSWETSFSGYNSQITFTDSPVSCFKEGTKILCRIDPTESNFRSTAGNHRSTESYHWSKDVYVPVEDIRSGVLVSSYKHGYRKVKLIGKGSVYTNKGKWYNSLYKMKKGTLEGMTDDLIVTGGHGILMDKFTDNELANQKKILRSNRFDRIDDKLIITAAISEKFTRMHDEPYIYYHFILENDGDTHKRYGVWANGVLVETPNEKQFLAHPYTLI